jgi:hypothetical protein
VTEALADATLRKKQTASLASRRHLQPTATLRSETLRCENPRQHFRNLEDRTVFNLGNVRPEGFE